MAKVKGYNPEHGDWFWVNFSPEEGYLRGKLAVACHEGMKSNDYIIVHALDEP
jgi:hypothetical protein